MKQEIGRNDPCPCGSGKKYKKCCGSPITAKHTFEVVKSSSGSLAERISDITKEGLGAPPPSLSGRNITPVNNSS